MNRLVARRRNDQRGVSLVLVLVALTIFGLIVPVLGQFGSVNGVSAYIVKGQRYDRYAAANGMNAAIAWAANQRTAGREHVPCPDIVTDVPGPSVTTNRHVVVKCTGFVTSGVPVLTDPSIPGFAVLGLNLADHSIEVDGDVSARLKTRGAWWANGGAGRTSADIHGVQVDATDDLFGATRRCHETSGGRIWAAPLQCDTGRAVADPGYASSLTTLADSQADPVLDCASIQANGVLALAPGIHWDAAFLTDAASGRCSAHRDVVIWFQPGAHYFDFDFYDRDADTEWTMGGSSRGRATVIGGVPVGWDPGGAPDQNAAARAAVSVDNAAVTAGACDLGASGVELVLGSTSHLTVESPTQFEVCPFRTDPAGQHLAISGPREGGTSPITPVGPETPISAVPNGRDFTWPAAMPAPPLPDALANADCGPRRPPCNPDLYVEGELSGRRAEAKVTMQVPNPFTKDARFEDLILTVSHREEESDGDEDRRGRLRDLSFELTGIPGSRVLCEPIGSASDDWTVALVQCRLETPVPMPDPDVVRNLGVVMQIRTDNEDRGSVTVALDHLAIRGAQTTASVRAQRCDCEALFFDNGAGAGSAFVWGTVYLPTADVKADFGGATAFKLARGVVTRTLMLENLADDRSFIPIELPGGGIYSTRTVAFEATVGDATEPTLKARVSFDDPTTAPGAPPVFPPPRITSWNPHK